MPIYEYKCKDCGSKNEFLVGVTADKTVLKCKKCESTNLEKLISSEFGISGFSKETGNNGSCCGMTNPCDAPKRCCTK